MPRNSTNNGAFDLDEIVDRQEQKLVDLMLQQHLRRQVPARTTDETRNHLQTVFDTENIRDWAGFE